MNSDTLLQKVPPLCGNSCTIARHSPTGLGNQFKTFFTQLFNTADWPDRWHCGTWTDFHGWLYIISDLLIWAAYFTIPALLIRLVTKRIDIPFPRIIWLFGAFIILCGTTHLMDALIFWWPAYRLSALLRVITAVVSIITVFALYKIIPLIFSLRTVEQLEKEIAERKIAEDKLAASEFLLLEAGRMGKVGGWEVDVHSNTMLWSKAMYDIYELPYNHVVHLKEIFNYLPSPYKKMVRESVETCMKEGTTYDLEIQIITAKGKVIWARTRGEALYDQNGQLYKLRGVVMDIDKYKSNEIALNRSIEMVTQNNMQLKSFTHILSHNIRNYASNISLVSSLVDDSTLDENNREVLEKIRKISKGLNTTLQDLSQAIRIRENVVSSQLLNFREIADGVLSILASDIEATHATFDFQFEVETVFFPKIYLESILLNLVSNAIKYRKNQVAPHIILRSCTNAQFNTILECEDNGMGIDLSLHGSKIFGLYKTFHDSKDSNGVGLFLIKTQITSQGGQIFVDSIPDKGTTFTIVFNEKNQNYLGY